MINKIAICSLFRDNAETVKKYFDDHDKWEYPQEHIVHVCVEGDSIDNTYDLLNQETKNRNLIVQKLDFNLPKYPSIVDPTRFRILANSWNLSLELALKEKPDYIFILDSDITTQPDIITKLIERNKDVIAPMMFIEGTKIFRDTWAYWAGIRPFVERKPYHIRLINKTIIEVDGVGLPFMKREVIEKGARFTEAEEVKGLCASIKQYGYKIYVDSSISTWHPSI